MRGFDERTGDDRVGMMFWREELVLSWMATIGEDGAILRGMGDETVKFLFAAVVLLPVRRVEFAIEEGHLDEEDEMDELG